MESFIIVIHVLGAVAITGLVLIQQGKGADMGASFGSGASQTIFGSVGTGNVLTKSTSWLAVLFFATSLSLAVMARNQADQAIGTSTSSLIQNLDVINETQNTGAQPGAAVLPELPVDEAPASEETAAPLPEAQGDAPAAPEAEELQSEATEN